MAIPATLLRIDDIDFVDWAVRGITMTLEPIQQAAQLARDCRGELVDLALPQFQKYKFSISCTDQAAPVLDDVWPGKRILITCVPGLGVENSTDGALFLDARVTSWQTQVEEYEAAISWQLEGEQRV